VASKNSVENPKTHVTLNLRKEGRKAGMLLEFSFSLRVRSNCNSPIEFGTGYTVMYFQPGRR
jgi:hypothetical protein